MEGVLLGLEDTELLLLDASDYRNVLEGLGFDGQLATRMDLLRGSAVLGGCLQYTDLRLLGYAAKAETLGINEVLYEAGEVPGALYLVVQGTCKVGSCVAQRTEE
jgi:hypothetical protein